MIINFKQKALPGEATRRNYQWKKILGPELPGQAYARLPDPTCALTSILSHWLYWGNHFLPCLTATKETTFQELLRWSAKCMLCRNHMPECILESTCPHSDTLDKPSNSSSFQAIRPLCSAMPSHFVLLMLVVVCERHNVPQLFVEKNLYHHWNGSLIRASEWTKYWHMSGEHIISYE